MPIAACSSRRPSNCLAQPASGCDWRRRVSSLSSLPITTRANPSSRARAAKMEYVEYQRRHIFGALRMSSSDFSLTPAMRERLATGVDWDELLKDTLNCDDASKERRNGVG